MSELLEKSEHQSVKKLFMCAAIWDFINLGKEEFQMIWTLDSNEMATLIHAPRFEYVARGKESAISLWLKQSSFILPVEEMKAFAKANEFPSMSFLYHLGFPSSFVCASIPKNVWRYSAATSEEWSKLGSDLMATKAIDALAVRKAIRHLQM